MRLIRREDHGQTTWYRPPFQPADYTVPQRELADIAGYADFHGADDIITSREGPFTAYRTIERFTRDGKQWVLLWHSLHGWCLEVEVFKIGFGQVIPVAPQRAWEISCERDKQHSGRIVYE